MLAKLAVCATVLLGAAPTSAAADDGKAPNVQLIAIEQHVVDYTNAERERYKLPPLEVDPALMKSARDHCAWMARNHALQHTRQPVAENIAMGQQHSREAVGDWMNSSGHRANILRQSHRRIGVAAYRSPGGRIFWCQQFRP